MYTSLVCLFVQKRAIRAVNNSSFKTHSDPIFFRLELLNLYDTFKLGVFINTLELNETKSANRLKEKSPRTI